MKHGADRRAAVVLVVEDEGLLRAGIVEELTSAGFEVVEAGCGEEALELLDNGHSIDVVFTDLRLGGPVNGWDVAEASRAKRADVGVIYASGAPIAPSREVPESRYFDKPYRAADVVSACRHLCGRGQIG
ncbi:MAG TPA: response regulator [Afifellaceae bacterium]|nr:response regulator [Afifellaceae bacterium]